MGLLVGLLVLANVGGSSPARRASEAPRHGTEPAARPVSGGVGATTTAPTSLPQGVLNASEPSTRSRLAGTSGVFVVADGKVWSVVGDELDVYDVTTTQRVGSIAVTPGTVGMAASGDGVWLLTLYPGRPYHLTLVDPSALTIRLEEDLPGIPEGSTNPGIHLAASPGAAWVGGVPLWRIDVVTGAVTTIPLPDAWVYRMAVNSHDLWIATFGSAEIYRVDLITNVVTPIDAVPVPAFAWSIAADDEAAWATIVYSDKIGEDPNLHLVRINAATHTITTFNVPAITVAIGDGQVWAQLLYGGGDPGVVAQIDPDTGTIIRSLQASFDSTIGNPSGGPTFAIADGSLWDSEQRVTP
jgi:hypothetical protein